MDVHSVYSSETEAVNLDSSTGMSRVSKVLINVFEEVQHVLGNKVILRLYTQHSNDGKRMSYRQRVDMHD